jgi:hypothetical protein
MLKIKIITKLKQIYKFVLRAVTILEALQLQLEELKSQNLSLNSKLNIIMSTQNQRFAELNEKLNSVTNDIAQDYQTLLDAVQDKISEEEFAKAEANIARLQGIGASVENPIPDPVEEATDTTGTTEEETTTEGTSEEQPQPIY